MIRVLEYNRSSLFESAIDKMEFDNIKWLDLSNPTNDELQLISEKISLNIKDLKFATDPKESPRVEDLENYSVLILNVPLIKHRFEKKEIVTTSLGIFISQNLIMTIHKEESSLINEMFSKRNELEQYFSRGTSEIMVRIIEEILASFIHMLTKIELEIDKIEDEVLKEPKKELVEKIFNVKKTLIYFHKSVSTNVHVILKLEANQKLLNQSQLQSLRYVHTDLMQVSDMVNTYRDIISGTLEIYLSSINNNINTVMKKMTAWASLILIPTFIASLYGMNFRYMPEVQWKYGYAFAWFLIIVSVAVLYVNFKKKQWL